MSKTSPTKRTLDWLRDHGFDAGVVERFNSFTKRRNDLFGWIDIVAFKGSLTVGVQATSSDNLAARITKSADIPQCAAWTKEGGRRAWFFGWRKGGAAGTRKVWTCRILDENGNDITLQVQQDLLAVAAEVQP